MPIDAIDSSPRAIHTAAPVDPAGRKQVLDGEVFLKLLVTQLTHQDPSSPMNTNEMISQTTQLAMMEQLTALADSGTEAFALAMRQTATSLMGREVAYDIADGSRLSGVVTRVSFDAPTPTVGIGGADVPLHAIAGIVSASAAAH